MTTHNQTVQTRKVITGILLVITVLFYMFNGSYLSDAHAQAATTETPPAEENVTLVPGTVQIDEDMKALVATALGRAKHLYPNIEYFAATDIRNAEQWVFLSVIGLAEVDTNLSWRIDRGAWFGLVFLKQGQNGKWIKATVRGTPAFSSMLHEIPDRILNKKAKRNLDPLAEPDPNQGGGTYIFPWQAGTSMFYGSNGIHENGFAGVVDGWKAVDMLSDGNTSVGHAPNRLLASEAGTISYKCNDGTSVAVRMGNFFYTHLLNNSNLFVGSSFNQGGELGQMKSGSFSANCGFANQGTGWFHVHWGFPNTDLSVEGWTLSMSTRNWTKGSTTVSPNQGWILAGSTSGCSNPSPDSNQIGLYADENYCGAYRILGIGEYSNPSALGFANDSASSIKVGSNVKATLCKDDNYAGGCEDFTSDDSRLSDNSIGDNQVSSAKIASRSSGYPVTLYQHSGYGGSWCALANAGWTNGCDGQDNTASSIRILAGWSARVWQDSNRGGASRCFTSDVSDFSGLQFNENGSGNVNDAISSFQVYQQSNCPSLAPGAPTLISPANGQIFNEGEAINLSWSATGNEYYGEFWGGPGGTQTFGWQTGTTKNIGSQWAGYVYSWHVKARNGTSESEWSNTWTFTVRPGAPNNLSASAASCSQINLSWADNSGNEEGYKVYRNGSLIVTLGSGTTNYQSTGLSGNTSYSYVVKAYRGSIESNASNTATATTHTCPAGTPTLTGPTNGYIFNEGEAINLTWLATGNEYYGEVWGGPAGTLTFGWQTDTGKNLGSQWAGYTYSWHVKARNGTSESGWSNTWTFTVRPHAPSNLVSSAVSCSQINLSWADNSGNEEGYKVYRNGNLVATLGSGATNYQNTGLAGNTTYSYVVKAYRASIESSQSNTATATTGVCQLIPNTPSNFRVSSSTQTSITLTWEDVSNETGYNIYEWDGASFVYLASVGANVTSYTESRQTCGWDEFYELSAYNNNGESGHTSWIHGDTQPCPPAPSAEFDAWPRGGVAPFTTAFHIVDMSNIDSCSWDYGDGQTSTTCTQLHDHTYENAGLYTVVLTVSGLGGSNSMTLENYITVTSDEPTDLVRNSSFEDDANSDSRPDIWSTNAKFTRSNEIVAFDGNYVGKFRATDNSGSNSTQSVLNLSAGTTYNFSGWVNIPPQGDTTFTFKIQVIWKNASNGTIRTDLVKNYTTHTGGNWNEAVKTMVAPAGTVKADVKIVASSLNGTIYVDKFSLGGSGSVPTYTLTVNKTGTGSGSVTSNPTGINCGSDCSEDYSAGTMVTLTAVADPGSTFTGWNGGGCSGTGTCTVTINANTIVTADFTVSPSQSDLIIQSITTSPTNPQVNESVTFSVVIKNQGLSDASQFWVGSYVDTDFPAICGANAVDFRQVDSLPAGASQTITFDWDGFTTAGDHSVGAMVDTHCEISENDESNNTSSISVSVSGVVPPGTLIFEENFETEDRSFYRWTACATDDEDLSITAAARYAGNYGMQAVIDDNVLINCTSDHPDAETRYLASFRFHPNNIPMTSGDTHVIFGGYSGTSTMVLRVQFRKSSGNYQVQAGLFKDGSGWTSTSWQTISGNAYHLIELDWKAATGVGANNGSLLFKVDGVQLPELTGADNDTRRIDRARLGVVNAIDTGTRGAYYFDNFVSSRGNEDPGNATPSVNAGPDQTITLSSSATLDGTVTDDGLPNPPATVTTTWNKVSGPGTVTFGNPNAVDTTASFSTAGPYVLRLTANDSALSTSDEVSITVNSVSTAPIFADDFESGNFSAWTTNTSDGSDLSVTTAAKHAGNYGMQALIDDNLPVFVSDSTPNAEPRYRARFYFNRNTVSMVNGNEHYIFKGFSGTDASPVELLRVEVRRASNIYQLRASLVNDGTGWTHTAWVNLPDGWNSIEVDWRAASGAGANNGGLTLWINGQERGSTSPVDNDTRRIDFVRLGALNGIDPEIQGTYYFDAFESQRQTYIGP